MQTESSTKIRRKIPGLPFGLFNFFEPGNPEKYLVDTNIEN